MSAVLTPADRALAAVLLATAELTGPVGAPVQRRVRCEVEVERLK